MGASMDASDLRTGSSWRTAGRWAAAAGACLLLALGGTGCAALTNPVKRGLPAAELPPELRGVSRGGEQTIPMSLLGQPQPVVYRLVPGDVVGVYVEGVMDERLPIPIGRVPEQVRRVPPRGEIPSSIGYPVTVHEDGTLWLPQLPRPVRVAGMTQDEAEQAVRNAYVANRVLQADRARVVLSLVNKRLVHVLVFRRDLAGRVSDLLPATRVGLIGSGGAELVGKGITGNGYEIDLPMYQNDLLHAFALTGGFPGTSAARYAVIFRGGMPGLAAAAPMVVGPDGKLVPGLPGPACGPDGACAPGLGIVNIPLRLRPGEPVHFTAEDVILHDGDSIFVEAADIDTFYTGGLLPAAEHILPRDYDLDVIEAVSRVRGPMLNGAFGGDNLNGQLINFGIGNPSPKLLSVIRRLPDGRTVPIIVNLNRAFLDPRERILVQPGDVLILQETPGQAIVRYFTQVFNISGLFKIVNHRDAMINSTFTVP